MNRSIIKDNYRFLLYFKRKSIKVIHKFVGVNGFLGRKTFILIASGYHSKYIKSSRLL